MSKRSSFELHPLLPCNIQQNNTILIILVPFSPFFVCIASFTSCFSLLVLRIFNHDFNTTLHTYFTYPDIIPPYTLPSHSHTMTGVLYALCAQLLLLLHDSFETVHVFYLDLLVSMCCCYSEPYNYFHIVLHF